MNENLLPEHSSPVLNRHKDVVCRLFQTIFQHYPKNLETGELVDIGEIKYILKIALLAVDRLQPINPLTEIKTTDTSASTANDPTFEAARKYMADKAKRIEAAKDADWLKTLKRVNEMLILAIAQSRTPNES